MDAAVLPLHTPFSKKRLHARLTGEINQKKLFAAIDADPALIGAGVVYIDSQNTMVVLREFKPLCSIMPLKVIVREPPPHPISTPEFAANLKTKPRESRFVMEIVSAGLSCGAAILSWAVVFGSAGALPLTGGGSGALTVLGYSAAAASSAQCFNSTVRSGLEGYSPKLNDWLDSQEWYENTTIALDYFSLGGAAASGMMAIRAVKLLNAQGIPIREALLGLNRTQRKRLTQEIIRANQPGISNKMMKLAQRMGGYPSRYSNRQISATMVRQLKDALGATFSFTGSATNGSMRQFAVGIYEEVE